MVDVDVFPLSRVTEAYAADAPVVPDTILAAANGKQGS